MPEIFQGADDTESNASDDIDMAQPDDFWAVREAWAEASNDALDAGLPVVQYEARLCFQ